MEPDDDATYGPCHKGTVRIMILNADDNYMARYKEIMMNNQLDIVLVTNNNTKLCEMVCNDDDLKSNYANKWCDRKLRRIIFNKKKYKKYKPTLYTKPLVVSSHISTYLIHKTSFAFLLVTWNGPYGFTGENKRFILDGLQKHVKELAKEVGTCIKYAIICGNFSSDDKLVNENMKLGWNMYPNKPTARREGTNDLCFLVNDVNVYDVDHSISIAKMKTPSSIINYDAVLAHINIKVFGGRIKPFAQLSVITFNADGDKSGNIERTRKNLLRKTILLDMLNEYKPAFVFVTECTKTLCKSVCDDPSLNGTFEFTWNDTNAIVFNNNMYKISDCTSTVQTTLDSLKNKKTTDDKKTIDDQFVLIPRMCTRLVETRTHPKFKFLCVSWHGQNEFDYPTRATLLESLQTCIVEIAKNLRTQYAIVGGDFNLPSGSVTEKAGWVLYDSYRPTKRRGYKSIIDYFLVYNTKGSHIRCAISNLNAIYSIHGVTDEDFLNTGLLDHDPVLATVVIASEQPEGKSCKVSAINMHLIRLV